jgi:hypothetical protein
MDEKFSTIGINPSNISESEKEVLFFLNGLFKTYGVLSLPVIKQKIFRALKVTN